MATYKIRGSSHNVIYTYRTADGKSKQQWESYSTELEAVQRKAYIDFLQKNKRQNDIALAAVAYRDARAAQAVKETPAAVHESIGAPVSSFQEDNINRTYGEFIERFLPFYSRKQRFSPNTYDSYAGNLKNHILPYFGDRVMSRITAEDIDSFIDYLSKKPCQGSKSYGKKVSETPHLSSATIKKCYNVLMVGFPMAKKWGYVKEIPDTTPPAEKTKKRAAWEPQRVFDFLKEIEDDPILHLAVHMAFVCSLRAGEVVGVNVSTIDFRDRSMWITQIVQRVSDKSLAELPKEEIIKVFPKKVSTSTSSLILKGPKTEGSYRKQYLTTPLLQEIKQRLDTIRGNKEFFGAEYQDHGLLFCQADGTPLDPKCLDKEFKERQAALRITDKIEFQGLRKSGQMHKVRLSKNNYQLVAESSGQSPEVLMSNYNEALDSEKRNLSLLVETSFYPGSAQTGKIQASGEDQLGSLMEQMKQNPDLSRQLLQMLLGNALGAT